MEFQLFSLTVPPAPWGLAHDGPFPAAGTHIPNKEFWIKGPSCAALVGVWIEIILRPKTFSKLQSDKTFFFSTWLTVQMNVLESHLVTRRWKKMYFLQAREAVCKSIAKYAYFSIWCAVSHWNLQGDFQNINLLEFLLQNSDYAVSIRC